MGQSRDQYTYQLAGEDRVHELIVDGISEHIGGLGEMLAALDDENGSREYMCIANSISGRRQILLLDRQNLVEPLNLEE
ncbi:hypothetical protein PABG_11748 [Paracoccidioides brasiliensis Pb03]|nr:hypothetical protein PABG_11748 [Paracoccidioides brasiliensis Pb03]